VAIDGDVLVAGERPNRGADVHRWNGSTWVTEQSLLPLGGNNYDHFGVSVAVRGDTIFVGADENGTPEFGPGGSVYVFRRSGATWIERQKLTASDADRGDKFGNSVSLGMDDALVGATYNSDPGVASGSAYVFRLEGNNWKEKRRLTASDSSAADFFGGQVAIDGRWGIVGTYANDDACPTNQFCDSGSAYVYDIPICVVGIPVVSEWGLVVLGLLLLTGGSILIARRFEPAPRSAGASPGTNVKASKGATT
jgi:hypothetical protein